MVWSCIGAEEDAYYLLDTEGSEVACGGFSATARDLARLGGMIRCGGAIGDSQIVPEAVAPTIVSGVPDGYPRRVRFPALDLVIVHYASPVVSPAAPWSRRA
ncbi:hypothetical protein ACIBG6_05605 [Streptomyces sp. NPDC050842]|uniref:hypothetical protein n=1 Tax=Streptomyces sp. NPDC050842 TaxID=3365636 RepID=UPI003799926F